MQGEVRNWQNKEIRALRALRACNHAAELAVQASWLNRPSVCYGIDLQNARESQKSTKQLNLRASRPVVRAARARSFCRSLQYRRLGQTDLRSEFRCSATIPSTTSVAQRFRTEVTPPCSSLSEPPSKREPPRFARRLIKKIELKNSSKNVLLLCP